MNILGFLVYLMFVSWVAQPQDVYYFDSNGYAEHLHVDYTSDPYFCHIEVYFMSEIHPEIDPSYFPDLTEANDTMQPIPSGGKMPEGIRFPEVQCFNNMPTPFAIAFSEDKVLIQRVYIPLVVR